LEHDHEGFYVLEDVKPFVIMERAVIADGT